MKKWEYELKDLGPVGLADFGLLNKWGAEGWELVDLDEFQPAYSFAKGDYGLPMRRVRGVFKREVPTCAS